MAPHSTISYHGSTWLYDTLPWLYLAPHSTISYHGSTWLYDTLPWLCYDSTWLYLTLLFAATQCPSLFVMIPLSSVSLSHIKQYYIEHMLSSPVLILSSVVLVQCCPVLMPAVLLTLNCTITLWIPRWLALPIWKPSVMAKVDLELPMQPNQGMEKETCRFSSFRIWPLHEVTLLSSTKHHKSSPVLVQLPILIFQYQAPLLVPVFC